MPLTPAEKQKRYRDRLKNNPEKDAIQKQKARDRYHKTKTLIAEKSQREQRLTRRKWRKYKADERQRLSVLLDETPPSSSDRECVPIPSVSRGRKKLRRDRTKCFRENMLLREENKKLKRNVEKYKKRAQRLNRKEQLSSPPLRQANALIKMSFSSPKSASAVRLKPTLLKYFTLIQSMKEKYRKSELLKKKDLKSIVANTLLKKYRLLRSAGFDALGLKGSLRMAPQPRKPNVLFTKLREDVHKFFVRDDVSRASAGKRETVTQNKNKVQKRYLLGTQKSLHRKFIAENDTTCSYVFFTRNRPFL